jgi:hypothetical protein
VAFPNPSTNDRCQARLIDELSRKALLNQRIMRNNSLF